MPRIRNQETEPTQYGEGDVVWVKVHNTELWWPGQITVTQDFRFEKAKRRPFAVVAFFNERTYEVVKTNTLIYPFNCIHKLEFTTRGAKKAATPELKAKFCDDVNIAEQLLLQQAAIRAAAVARPDTLIKALITSSSSTTSQHSGSASRRHTPSIAAPPPSSSPCSTSSQEKDSTFRILDIGSSEGGPRNDVAYRCTSCDFSTNSMSVLLIHRNAHVEQSSVNGQSDPLLRSTRRSKMSSHASSCRVDARRRDCGAHATSLVYGASMRCLSRHVSIVVDATMTDREQQQVANIAEITMASIERVVWPERRRTQQNERSRGRRRLVLRSTMPAPEPLVVRQRRLTRSMSRRHQQGTPEVVELPTPPPLPPTRRTSRRAVADRRQTLAEIRPKAASPPHSSGSKRNIGLRQTMTVTRRRETSPKATPMPRPTPKPPTPVKTTTPKPKKATPKQRPTRSRSRLPTPPPPPPPTPPPPPPPPPPAVPVRSIDLEQPEARSADIADVLFDDDEAPVSLKRRSSRSPLQSPYVYCSTPKPQPKPQFKLQSKPQSKPMPAPVSEEQCAASLVLQQSLLAEWFDDMDESPVEPASCVQPLPAAIITNGKGGNKHKEQDKQQSGNKRKQRSRSSSSGAAAEAQTKKRIRNIPKKDRRDVVLQEFDVAAPGSGKPTAAELIVIQDSDASSNESVVFVEAEPELEPEPQPEPQPEPKQANQGHNTAAAVEQSKANTSSCFDFAEEDEEELPAPAQPNDGQNGLSYRRRMKSSCASVSVERAAAVLAVPNGQQNNEMSAEDEQQQQQQQQQLLKDSEERETLNVQSKAVEPEPDQMSLPIKERQKRIFKSRNKSLQALEQPPLASCSATVLQQELELDSAPMTPSDEATCSSLGKQASELLAAPLTPLTERNSTPTTLANGDSSNSSRSSHSHVSQRRKPLHTKTEQRRRRRHKSQSKSKSHTPLPYAEPELQQPSPISTDPEELSNNSLQSSSASGSRLASPALSTSTSCSIASNIAVISAEEARELQRTAPGGSLGHRAAIIDATQPVQRGGVLILENIRLPNLYERPFSRGQSSSLLSETDSRDSNSKPFMSSSASDATVVEQEEHTVTDEPEPEPEPEQAQAKAKEQQADVEQDDDEGEQTVTAEEIEAAAEEDETEQAEEEEEEADADLEQNDVVEAEADSDQEIPPYDDDYVADEEEEAAAVAATKTANITTKSVYEISDLDVTIQLDQSVVEEEEQQQTIQDNQHEEEQQQQQQQQQQQESDEYMQFVEAEERQQTDEKVQYIEKEEEEQQKREYMQYAEEEEEEKQQQQQQQPLHDHDLLKAHSALSPVTSSPASPVASSPSSPAASSPSSPAASSPSSPVPSTPSSPVDPDHEESNWQDWHVLEAAEMGGYVAQQQREVPLKKREQELLRKYEADLLSGRSAEKCRKVRERWLRNSKSTIYMQSAAQLARDRFEMAASSSSASDGTILGSNGERRTASQTFVAPERHNVPNKAVSSRSCDALRYIDPPPLSPTDVLIAQQQWESLRAERPRLSSLPMPLQQLVKERQLIKRLRNVVSDSSTTALGQNKNDEVLLQTQQPSQSSSPLQHQQLLLPPPTPITATQQQQPAASIGPESPVECNENPYAIAGLQQHQLGAGRICAVMTRPIPGYNHTFMLCSLANNNFTPLNSVALYLDSEKNHLVPVPREALTEPPRLADGHPLSAVFADIDFLGGEAAMTQVVESNAYEQCDEHTDNVVVVDDNAAVDEVHEDAQLMSMSTLDAATEATVAAAGYYAPPALDQADVDGIDDVVSDVVPALGNDNDDNDNDMEQQDDDEHLHANVLLLSVNGHRLQLETSLLISLAQEPNTCLEVNVPEGGRVVLHGSDILQAAKDYLQERDLTVVNSDDLTEPTAVPQTAPPSDLLAEALASSDVVSATTYMAAANTGDALLHIGHGVIDTDANEDDDDDDAVAVGAAGGVYISHTLHPPAHLTPPITASTNETSALLNQTPIMSTLENPSAVQMRRVSPLSTNHANLEDSLAVIGVTAGHGNSSGVPTSLELPITVTNPAIAPRVAAPAADLMPAFAPFQ